MDEALAEARLALAEGEVPVGCVLVSSSGVVVARGRNATHVSGDATAHAELVALRALSSGGDDMDFGARDLTLYVTCEPCVMCAAAVLQTRLLRAIVFGCANPRFGGCGSVRPLSVHRLPEDEMPKVTRGVREQECLALLVAFYQTQNPYAPVPKMRRKRRRDPEPNGHTADDRERESAADGADA